MTAVCEQGEWEAMELAQPGHHTLVRASITNEGEAERLARSSSGYVSTSKPSALNRPDAKQATRPLAGIAALVAGEVALVVLPSSTIPVPSPLP